VSIKRHVVVAHYLLRIPRLHFNSFHTVHYHYQSIAMRFSSLSVLLLSGLSIASPVVSKRADAVSLLTDLYATVQIYTGAISTQSYQPPS